MNEIAVANIDADAPAVVAPPRAPLSLLDFVAQAVRDPNIDVAKLDTLLRMQREIAADDARAQFNADFIAVQQELPRVKKNGVLEYPTDKSKPDGPKRKIASYAKLEDIDLAVRPILSRNGFGVGYTTLERQGGGLTVICILRHRAGHSTETPFPVPLDTSGGKNNIQGMGSAETYGRRYALCAALNIITEGEDDDGVKGGARFISDEQAAEIEQLFADTQTDADRFLHQFFGVVNLPNLPLACFVPAKNMLLQKKNRRS